MKEYIRNIKSNDEKDELSGNSKNNRKIVEIYNVSLAKLCGKVLMLK